MIPNIDRKSTCKHLDIIGYANDCNSNKPRYLQNEARYIRLSYIYYYTDASVLQESNQWRIFHILTSEDIDDVIYHILH